MTLAHAVLGSGESEAHGSSDGALAMLHYVGYRAFNIIRHHPEVLNGGQELDGLLQQCLVEAMRGRSFKPF